MAWRHRVTLGVWAAWAASATALAACANLSSLSSGPGGGGDGGTDGTVDGTAVDVATDSKAPDVATDTAPADTALAEAAPADAGGCDADPCVLATGLNHPVMLVSDNQSVYWTEFGDATGSGNGAVKSCPASGCGPSGPLVIASALINPVGVAVGGATVYFDTAGSGTTSGGIFSCPTSGCNGSPTMIATASVPQQIVLDSLYVYWVDSDDDTAHRAPRAGGADQVLYDGGQGLVVEPQFCAVDSTSLYIGDVNQDITRIPLAGGTGVQLLSAGTNGLCPIVLDSANVYYGALGQIVRMSKSSTDGGVPIATNLQYPTSLALDPSGGTIYWSDFGPGAQDLGSVGKVGTNGAGQTAIASGLPPTNGVALVGPYVLWVTSGTIMSGNMDTLPSTGILARHAK